MPDLHAGYLPGCRTSLLCDLLVPVYTAWWNNLPEVVIWKRVWPVTSESQLRYPDQYAAKPVDIAATSRWQLMIAGESPSSLSTLSRVFPAVQYLGCEALTMILVQSTDADDDLSSVTSPVFTIGQRELCTFQSNTYRVILCTTNEQHEWGFV